MSSRAICLKLALAALATSATALGQPTVWFVDATATGGTQSGDSWANAFLDLQDAFDEPQLADGHQIWVAAIPDDFLGPNAYIPSVPYCASCPTAGTRHATFRLRSGVGVYGGFRGADDSDPNNPFPGESSLSQRNEEINVTILSGDLDQDDNTPDPNRGENAYHVVTAHNVTENTKLSGFMIYGGNANDLNLNDIYERSGAGVLVVGTGVEISSLHITRCVFFDHAADDTGAGVAVNWPGIPEEPEDIIPARIVSSTFTDNIADPFDPEVQTGNGGGLSISRAAFEVTNCVFDENTAAFTGGGAYANGGGSNAPRGELTNNTFYLNKALSGLALSVNSDTDPANPIVFLNNSICWDDPDRREILGPVDVSYSDIQSPDPNDPSQPWPSISYPGSNIRLDPQFCNEFGNNFRLEPSSPCIDAGLDLLVPPDNTDIDADSVIEPKIPWDRGRESVRQFDSIPNDEWVDMGAFEYLHTQNCPYDLNGDLRLTLRTLRSFWRASAVRR